MFVMNLYNIKEDLQQKQLLRLINQLSYNLRSKISDYILTFITRDTKYLKLLYCMFEVITVVKKQGLITKVITSKSQCNAVNPFVNGILQQGVTKTFVILMSIV